MEVVLEQDSPLASYLEGQGTHQHEEIPAFRTHERSSLPPSFAPPSRPIQIRSPLQSPKPPDWPITIISKVQDAYARAVSSTLGRADNERFVEHFRYIIIASQLLNEHVGVFSKSYANLEIHSPIPGSSSLNSGTLLGASVSALLAFGIVWLIHWTRDAVSSNLRQTRFILACSIQALGVFLLYAYVRRHWLKFLRQQAVVAASIFVEEVQQFESSLSSILKQIQEIEIVSRGYQISRPLPPISRLELGEKPRTCHHLRRSLRCIYDSAIDAILDAIHVLQHYVSDADFHKFLEIYDVQAVDTLTMHTQNTDEELGKLDSLVHLRELQYRFSGVRRLLLCSLLSIPATGRKEDRIRWRTCVERMTVLGAYLNEMTERIDKILLEEENLPSPLPLIGNTRPSSSVHNPHLTAFALQLRTLHAKLHLVRSDVGRLNSTSPSMISSSSTREQFDAVGSDLKALVQTWEQGRTALDDLSADRQKQFDTNVSGLGLALGNATKLVQVKGEGEQAEALKLPSTALPASPPLSAHSGSGDELQCLRAQVGAPLNVAEAEVFEGMSQAKRRPHLAREQRIMKMQEDREKGTKTKERREASSNMIRELQAVINLRPSAQRKGDGNRVTS